MRSNIRFAAVILLAINACGDRGADQLADLPWQTVIDSTSGDTIVATVTGEVPPQFVSTLVSELEIGTLDGPEELTFGSVGDVIGLANGGMLVHDDGANAHILRLYDSTGAFVRNVGGKGGGPGEYGHLNGVARLPNGQFIAWDAAGGRINRYSAAGDYLGLARSPFTGWFMQHRLYADTAGHIVIWAPILRDENDPESRQDGYITLDTLGTPLDTVLMPIWPGEADLLTATSPDGGSTRMQTRPFAANSVTNFHQVGGMVSGLGTRYEFVVIPNNGRVLRVVREHTPVPVSETESREQRTRIEMGMRQLNPGWNWTGAPIATTKPAYSNLLVGGDGRIWVHVSTPSEPIPEAEIDVPQPSRSGRPPLPPLTTREPRVYDVFSASGRLLGRVALPNRTVIHRTAGNYAWGYRIDENDVERAVRFRIEPALQPD